MAAVCAAECCEHGHGLLRPVEERALFQAVRGQHVQASRNRL
jgi:hypothetical protein